MLACVLIALTLLAGCNAARTGTYVEDCGEFSDCAIHAARFAAQIEYPDVERCWEASEEMSLGPRTLDDPPPTEFWNISFDELLGIALSNSEVLRDLGGRVLQSPDTVPSTYDPAVRESDPLFGPEGALSAFDTQFAASLYWQENDRALNNVVLGGGTRELVQDVGTFRAGLSKTAATGTHLSVHNLTTYDTSNQPGNKFPSGWDTQFEANIRQPLLQGAGVTFNRIAGPNAEPGFHFSNGVLIARVNTDISLADFEAGVRDFVSQVVDAYWELNFAYRDLDAKILARDRALETWHAVQAQRGLPGGTAEREARARAQYYQLQDLVQDALSGTPVRVRTVGVYKGERRLRLLAGLPVNDGRMMRPSDDPPDTKIVYDWRHLLDEAFVRRVELRRQMWKIKRRELELIAARNFLLPRVDLAATYRARGFGDNLTGDGGPNASAFKDLGTGHHQEWGVGVEVTMPFGHRRAWAGVRQAELNLVRERAVLDEQERTIANVLADAVAEVSRAHAAIRTSYGWLNAAAQRLNAAEEVARVDRVSVDLVLEAQQDVVAAQTRYYQALTDHAIALKNVHLQKGSLLDYNGIFLSEGPWPNKAYGDAIEKSRRWRPKHFDYRFEYPPPLSVAGYAQRGEDAIPHDPEAYPEEPSPADPFRDDTLPEAHLAPIVSPDSQDAAATPAD